MAPRALLLCCPNDALQSSSAYLSLSRPSNVHRQTTALTNSPSSAFKLFRKNARWRISWSVCCSSEMSQQGRREHGGRPVLLEDDWYNTAHCQLPKMWRSRYWLPTKWSKMQSDGFCTANVHHQTWTDKGQRLRHYLPFYKLKWHWIICFPQSVWKKLMKYCFWVEKTVHRFGFQQLHLLFGNHWNGRDVIYFRKVYFNTSCRPLSLPKKDAELWNPWDVAAT